MSAVVSQAFVNFMLRFPNPIVEQLAWTDIYAIWIYDFSWLIIIDLVKMSIIRIQDGAGEQVSLEAVNRQSFANVRASRASKRSSKVGAPKLADGVRVSISGQPITPRGTSVVDGAKGSVGLI